MHGRIAVFDDSASGDALPLYTIEGTSTGLDLPAGYYFTGIGHDPYLHRLMAASSSNTLDSTRNRIVVFHDDAIGDVEPAHAIEGAGIGTGSPGTPFAVPTDAISANGFDG